MRRYVALGMLALLLLSWQAPVRADDSKKVNCVYPGEVLASALGDLAGQLGYAFTPGDFEESYDLQQPVWVMAKAVTPAMAARMVGASAGVRVELDASSRSIRLTDPEMDRAANVSVKGFDTTEHCRQYMDYLDRYGPKTDSDAPTEGPTAAETLRDAIEEILRLGETEGSGGSAVGKRLVYTRDADDLANITELLQLLKSDQGGESAALRLDRTNREALRKLHSDFRPGDSLLSALLYQMFKDCPVPVYIDESLMSQLDLESDVTNVTLRLDQSHFDALQALAREMAFAVDSVGGALRLHEQDYEGGASYRVFNLEDLLASLDQDYKDLRTRKGWVPGDLRSEGGITVIVDALETQLEAAGYSPLIRAHGARLVVAGGVGVIDAAVEVLQAIGWTEKKGEDK